MAGSGRRRRHPRFERRRLPAPAKPGGRAADRRPAPDLRHADRQRRADAAELHPFPRPPDRPVVQPPLGARPRPMERIEGMNLPEAKRIKDAVGIPVLCTGGFQTAAIIEHALVEQMCDAVTIARPLIANNDLVKIFASGVGRPPRPCTYCNRCLVNAVENPLGCYEEKRFDSLRRHGRADHDRVRPPALRVRTIRMSAVRVTSAALLLVLCLSILVAASQTSQPDSDSFPDVVDHFKYGSIGTEEGVGIPYWIWKVLPTVFEDKLPQRPGTGYERLGFVLDPSRHQRPIGTSYKDDRVALVGLNCATCHVGTVRETRRRSPPHRSRNAGEPDGSAGVCELPDRVRQRPALRLRHADDGNPQGESRHRFLHAPGSIGCSSSGRRRTEFSSGRSRTRGSIAGRRSGPAASIPSTRTRSCSRSRSTTSSARWICRRCGTSGCGRGCGCTGTATTTSSRSATRAPPSAPARRPTRSTSTRCAGSRTGSSI